MVWEMIVLNIGSILCRGALKTDPALSLNLSFTKKAVKYHASGFNPSRLPFLPSL